MASKEVEVTKASRKLHKKLNRLKEQLNRQDRIISTDNPSSVLCICNGGLDNNVTYEEIVSLFRPYGSKCDVIMIPKKSYAFVCYGTSEESMQATANLNGYTLQPNNHRKSDVILYTLFVKQVPESIAPSRDKPPGLVLLEDFVSEEYAAEILESVDWTDHDKPGQQQQLKHRKVKHYGYEFKYSINNVDPDDPLPEGIPDIYRPLLNRLLEEGIIKHYPDQLTVNQYQPGQGIPPHVDTPEAFEDGLVSLSLGSQVVMEFRHPGGQHLSVLLPPRSVLVMTGESRYIWSHGITPRKSDIVALPDGGLTLSQRGVRTSFTFRKLTGVRPPKTDSENRELPSDDQTAAQLENLHVYQVYDEIAEHFSGTRHTPWPNIAEFLKAQPPGSLLVDIGCGNGKYFGINKSLFEIGSDRSQNLAKIVKEKNFEVYVGDVLSIPLRETVFDVCLCIAVIHHLSTQERRHRAISQLLKILRPGGKALIYVWAMEQELEAVKSKYLKKSEQCAADAVGSVINSDQTLLQSSSNMDSANSCDNHVNDKKGCERYVGGQQNEEKCDSPCDNLDSFIGTGLENNNELQSVCTSRSKPPKLEVHVNRTQFKQQDLLVPWQLKGKDKKSGPESTFHRFYHVFQKGELEALCESIQCCKVIKSYYDQGNWAVVLEKL